MNDEYINAVNQNRSNEMHFVRLNCIHIENFKSFQGLNY